MCVTRSDIHFGVNKLSQYMQDTSICHWKDVLRVLRYLKGTLDHGLLIRASHVSSNNVVFISYADANWDSGLVDRNSASGHYLLHNGNTIVWSSKKQSVISRSSAEVEYITIVNAVCEVI